MKHVIVCAFICLGTILFAQESQIPIVDGKIEYSKVFEFKGKSKKELYLLSKEWISEYYKSSKAVTDFDDLESGKIYCKGLATYLFKDHFVQVDVRVEHTLKIFIKEERVKVVFTNIYFPGLLQTGKQFLVDIPKRGKKTKLKVRPINVKGFVSIWESISTSIESSFNKKSQEDDW